MSCRHFESARSVDSSMKVFTFNRQLAVASKNVTVPQLDFTLPFCVQGVRSTACVETPDGIVRHGSCLSISLHCKDGICASNWDSACVISLVQPMRDVGSKCQSSLGID